MVVGAVEIEIIWKLAGSSRAADQLCLISNNGSNSMIFIEK